MGLDWIVESKPSAGDEKEYSKLKKQLKKLRLKENEENCDEIMLLEKQLEDISISPQDTISDLNEEELNELDEIMEGGSFLTSSLDFRGKAIGLADIINEELQEEAYTDHTPKQCIDYAERLELAISSYNKENLDEDETEDFENISKGIKWLKFWGENGHGYHAWY
jgi:hypothetical protein